MKKKIDNIAAHIIVNAFYVAVLYGGLWLAGNAVNLLLNLFGL